MAVSFPSEHPLPFDPDEILTARETFRRLSAVRRAARQRPEPIRFNRHGDRTQSTEARLVMAAEIAEAVSSKGKWVAELYPLQHGKCYLCGGPFGDDGRRATLEHVTPRALGGRNHRNILLACIPCNQAKADRPPTPTELAFLAHINLLRYGA